MGAVAVFVEVVDRVVVVAEVPAVDVVHIAVAVIVDAVGLLAASGLAGVGPRLGGEVRVVEVDAVVDHGDHDVRVAGRQVQGLESVDVGIGQALGPVLAQEQLLARVVETPELVEVGLVGRIEVADVAMVDADPEDRGIGLEGGRGGLRPRSSR